MKKIGLLLIATNKYHQFVEPLLKDIDKNFLPGHKITVHLFNDKLLGSEPYSDRVDLKYHSIPSYGFPQATLYRYKIFNEHMAHLVDYDHLFYMDVDMSIPQPVGNELLEGDITAVRHPGFFKSNGWGSPNNSTESTSYIEPEYRQKYFCGGVQGGIGHRYLAVSKDIHYNIKQDEEKGVMAEWHDETHWNAFLNKHFPEDWKLNELTPEYCNVPSMQQRQNWGIHDLPGRILALDKNHAEIRS